MHPQQAGRDLGCVPKAWGRKGEALPCASPSHSSGPTGGVLRRNPGQVSLTWVVPRACSQYRRWERVAGHTQCKCSHFRCPSSPPAPSWERRVISCSTRGDARRNFWLWGKYRLASQAWPRKLACGYRVLPSTRSPAQTLRSPLGLHRLKADNWPV